MDSGVQAGYKVPAVSPPVSPLYPPRSPILQRLPTSLLFPELDEYGRLGWSFEDSYQSSDEDGQPTHVEHAVAFESDGTAENGLQAWVEVGEEFERDLSDPLFAKDQSANREFEEGAMSQPEDQYDVVKNVQSLPSTSLRLKPFLPDTQRFDRLATGEQASHSRSRKSAVQQGSPASPNVDTRGSPFSSPSPSPSPSSEAEGSSYSASQRERLSKLAKGRSMSSLGVHHTGRGFQTEAYPLGEASKRR